jgi:hypothetical protein
MKRHRPARFFRLTRTPQKVSLALLGSRHLGNGSSFSDGPTRPRPHQRNRHPSHRPNANIGERGRMCNEVVSHEKVTRRQIERLAACLNKA